MNNSFKILVSMIVIAIIAIGGYSLSKSELTTGGGYTNEVVNKFTGGLTIGKTNQVVVDERGNTTRSPDGFVLWDDFTVGTTTSVIRGTITNTGDALMCDGESLFVYSDATADFAPSFRFAVGTSTTAGYSANLLASTTVATTTDTVNQIGTGWNFLVPNGTSLTLSVGDTSAAIASSTHYGNWSGQFGVHCWNLGQ